MSKREDLTAHHLSDVCMFIGAQFHAQQNHREAEFWYKKIPDLKSDCVDAKEAIMYTLISQRKFAEGIPYADYVEKNLPPEAVDRRDLAIYNRGLMNLHNGNYPAGFKDYDSRMRMGKTMDILRKKLKSMEKPMWTGQPCEHLLVYGEQGMGDLFMFGRYIHSLKECGLVKRITFEVPPEMESFMKYNFEADNVIVKAQTEDITPSDEYILLVSLGRIFNTTIDTIPYSVSMPHALPVSSGASKTAYLKAEPDYIEKWKKIRDLPGYKVGICWAGRPNDSHSMQVVEWNVRRSIGLDPFEPIFENLKNTTFVSIQKGDTEQLAQFSNVANFTDELNSWSDTAGIIANLDCVVSIDSGPVHLAGAMGKKTLLLNHMHTCWRWNETGVKGPWYDSVQVIRQRKLADWTGAMEELYDHLLEHDK